FSLQTHSRKGIHADIGRVAGAHMADLRFFIVSLHPYVALDERNYLSPWTDQLSRAHSTFADEAACRRRDSRITQLDLSECERRYLRIQIGAKQKLVGVQHSTLALLRFEFGLRAAHVGERSG